MHMAQTMAHVFSVSAQHVLLQHHYVSVIDHGCVLGTMNSGLPDGRFEQWVIVSVHGLNSFFALTEIVLPVTAPLPFTHLVAALVVMSLYLALAYMTRRAGMCMSG
jgi:hypothetical protein